MVLLLPFKFIVKYRKAVEVANMPRSARQVKKDRLIFDAIRQNKNFV